MKPEQKAESAGKIQQTPPEEAAGKSGIPRIDRHIERPPLKVMVGIGNTRSGAHVVALDLARLLPAELVLLRNVIADGPFETEWQGLPLFEGPDVVDVIKWRKPDILLACEITDELLLNLSKISGLTKVVYHMSVNLLELTQAKPELLPSAVAFLKHVPHIIAPAQWVKDFLASMGIHQVTHIPNGVILATRGEAIATGTGDAQNDFPWSKAARQSKHIIGIVTRLFPSKFLLTPIAALRPVLKEVPDARLVIAGGGPLTKELDEVAESIGVRPAIEMLGELPHELVWQLYDQMKVLVHPSSTENAPLSVLEALASGRPVLASDNAGAREILPPEWLYRADDPGQLAGMLIRILEPESWARASQQALAIGRRYDWAEQIPKFWELFERVVRMRYHVIAWG